MEKFMGWVEFLTMLSLATYSYGLGRKHGKDDVIGTRFLVIGFVLAIVLSINHLAGNIFN
jgi:hypothetical protein